MARGKAEPLVLEDAERITRFMHGLGVQRFKIGDLEVVFRDPRESASSPKPDDEGGDAK